MKKVLIIAGLAVLAVAVFLAATALHESQRADYGWDPAVESPAFKSAHPRVVLDQAHCNASTGGIGGRYWPFRRLLKADGYEVELGKAAFTAQSLAGVRVLVIANAAGAPKPQFMGINLPSRTSKDRADPAFTAEEIQSVLAWVEEGGSLLLIADHAPMGAAAAGMAAAFGITMGQGFVEVPNELSDPLLFSRENGRLGDHPILAGDGPESAIQRVMTFTGQSLTGPADASVLLSLPESAVEYVPAEPEFIEQPAGPAQGLAFEWGKGRVVVLGEAAMMTAQVHKGVPFGMNSTGNDNRRFALNVMHWLSGVL